MSTISPHDVKVLVAVAVVVCLRSLIEKGGGKPKGAKFCKGFLSEIVACAQYQFLLNNDRQMTTINRKRKELLGKKGFSRDRH